MSEEIISVNTNFKLTHDYIDYVGIQVVTNRQTILCLIEDAEYCREEYDTRITDKRIVGRKILSTTFEKINTEEELSFVIKIKLQNQNVELTAWVKSECIYAPDVLTQLNGQLIIEKIY